MTVLTIRSNRKESDDIADNKIRHIIRSASERFNVGDVIHFQCYEKRKPVYHRGNILGYVVTMTQDSDSAPVEKGFQIVSFRRCEL